MYTKFFGLNDKPFSLIPDRDAVYFSPGHLSAFTMLEFGVLEQQGITVITGDVGTGKTTLIRHLLSRMDYERLTLGLVSTPHSAFGSVLQWIVNAFNIDTDSDDDSALLGAFQQFIVDQYALGKRTVVIIDEAQNMSSQDLEALRLLTNINIDKNQLLQIVLVGQPELLDAFFDPSMSQLAQRVCAEYNLNALDLTETLNYIRHKIESVGGKREIFDVSAMLSIYYFSGGIPRIINTLCDGALVFAYGMNSETVSLPILLDVVKNKKIGGVQRAGLDSPARETVRDNILKRHGIDLRDAIST